MAGLGSTGKASCAVKRHRVTIQAPTETLDATGQPVVTWTDVWTDEPAEFKPMGGVESMRGKQYEAGTKGVFRVNYRDSYTVQMRVVHNSVNYGITNVNQVDGLRREIDLVVKT
jgi:SPP1 family predicted phage head-tail adaptor